MIFAQSLQKIDPMNTQDAIKKMYNHMKYIQEELEYKLSNLDSSNINEIDVTKTTITDSSGSTNIGTYINLSGSNGEVFTAGQNSSGKFELTVRGKGGKQVLYLDSAGDLIITKHTNLTIDGGEW